MSQSYHFNDFNLKPDEQSLFYKKERIEIGLKGFKLLVLLVMNHGKIVPKDELIKKAWEKQIVTDGTLSKQIERIRQALSQKCPNTDYIETVRGIGYKFVAKVKTHKDRKKDLVKWQKVIASVSIIPIILFLYFYPFGQQKSDKDKEDFFPLNMAVIPSATGQDYMNVGGLSYLSNLLDKNPRILVSSPQSSWYKHENKQQLAIEIEDQKQLDYVLFVNISQNKDAKSAVVQLKNTNNYNNKDTIVAQSHKELFSKINSWVRDQLKINNVNNDYNDNLSNDEFALESYLRGMKESNERNYKKAIDYFQTAINQDNDFDLARLRKAEAQILTSDYNSAEAIIETLLSKNIESEELNLLTQTMKANVLTYSERANQAKPIVESALILSNKLKNTKISEKLLYLQSTIYLQENNISKAINSALKQLDLLQKNVKESSRINRVENNLGYFYYYSKNYNQASKYLASAITGFEKQNAIAGLFSSYSMMGSILYQQAKFDQAKTTINKADALLDQIENKRLVLGFLETKSYLLIELGLHDEAKKTINEIESLSQELGTKEPVILAKGALIELAIKVGNKSSIALLYEDFMHMADEIKTSFPMMRTQMLFKLMQADLFLENIQSAQNTINELMQLPHEQQENWKTEITILRSQLMLKTRGAVKAKRDLNELLKKSIKDQHYLLALNVGNTLIEYELEQDKNFNEANRIINLMSQINPFPYPYLKLKAQIVAHNGNFFEATKLMQQLKLSSNHWWNTKDQLLLDNYTHQLQKNAHE